MRARAGAGGERRPVRLRARGRRAPPRPRGERPPGRRRPDDRPDRRSGGPPGRPRPRRSCPAEDPEVRATYELRYEGQAFELPVDGDPRPDPAELRRAFDRAHEDRYGYSDPDANLELVTIRVAVALPGAEPRPAEWDGLPAEQVDGPEVVPLPGSTLVIPEGWRARAERGPGGDGRTMMPCGDLKRSDHAPGAARQPARRLRRDGRGAGALGALGEHQGAPGRLHRPVRRRRADGHAGRAHPGAPRRDAVGRRGGARRGAAAGRVLDPQRPVPGRHPPARHHGDHAAVPRGRARRVRGEPRASRRRGRRGARQHARLLAHARGRGRRDPAHPADRTRCSATSPAGCATRASARRTSARSSPPAGRAASGWPR